MAPVKAGVHWAIAGPLGGVLSGVLGVRATCALGQGSFREGRIHVLLWAGLGVAACYLLSVLARGLSYL